MLRPSPTYPAAPRRTIFAAPDLVSTLLTLHYFGRLDVCGFYAINRRQTTCPGFISSTFLFGQPCAPKTLVLLAMTIRAKHVAFVQLTLDDGPLSIRTARDLKIFFRRVSMMKVKRRMTTVIAASRAFPALIGDCARLQLSAAFRRGPPIEYRRQEASNIIIDRQMARLRAPDSNGDRTA